MPLALGSDLAQQLELKEKLTRILFGYRKYSIEKKESKAYKSLKHLNSKAKSVDLTL